MSNNTISDFKIISKMFFQMGPQPTKHLSKKAKRKLATTQMQESSIAAHMPGEKNKIVMYVRFIHKLAYIAFGL